jgi:hypothetical protein
MMKTLTNKFAALCFCLFVSLQLHAQDLIKTYLTANPVLIEKWNERKQVKHSKVAFIDTVDIDPSKGLLEDFSYPGPYPDPFIWIDSFAYVNRTYPYAPPTIGVATFDGLNQYGYPYDFTAPQNSSQLADYLTSRPFDLAKYAVSDSMYFSFYYQPQGRGNSPAARDSLVLEFKSPDSFTWDHIWSKSGTELVFKDTLNWGYIMIPITNVKYLKRGFQFRFKNYATVCGSFDHWHIDFIHLFKDRSITNKVFEEAAYVYEHPSLLKKYQVMPWRQYTKTDVKDSVLVVSRNNYTTAKNISSLYRYTDENGATIFFKDKGGSNVSPFSLAGYNKVFDSVPVFPLLTKITSFFAKTNITPSPDKIIANNELVFEQKFGNYFAYDDGTAETAFSLNSLNAQFAMKYQLNVADTLRYVDIYFNPMITNAADYTFNLKVWSDNAGQPGTELAISRTLSPRYSKSGLNAIIRYGLDAPLALQPGVFYVGFMQNTNNSLGVGVDLNSNNQLNSFYNNGFGWNTAPYPGSAIIHPVFGTDSAVTAVSEINLQNKLVEIYPNPATTDLSIRSTDLAIHKLNYSLVDVYGRLVENGTLTTPAVINLSHLTKGIYFIRVTEENRTSTLKFIKIE